jgi:hypothetical protein
MSGRGIILLFLLVPFPAQAQHASASAPARDPSTPHFWIDQAVECALQQRRRGADIDWIIEALAWSGDHKKLRDILIDYEARADRFEGLPPSQAMGYATCAYGYARINDVAASDRTAGAASDLSPEIEGSMRDALLLMFALTAAARGNQQDVEDLAMLSDAPLDRVRTYAAAAVVASWQGNQNAYATFLASARRLATAIDDPRIRGRALLGLKEAQFDADDIDDLIETVDLTGDVATRVVTYADIAERFRFKRPELSERMIRDAVVLMPQLPPESRTITFGRLAQAAWHHPQLSARVRELAPLAAAAQDSKPESIWEMARSLAYLGDFEASMQALASVRPTTNPTDRREQFTLAHRLADVARALTTTGRFDLAEQVTAGLDFKGLHDEVSSAIASGHVEAGRIDEALKILETRVTELSDRWSISMQIGRRLSRLGEFDRLVRWTSQIKDVDERKYACLGAAMELAGRQFWNAWWW